MKKKVKKNEKKKNAYEKGEKMYIKSRFWGVYTRKMMTLLCFVGKMRPNERFWKKK
jgi:hypothetical protein